MAAGQTTTREMLPYSDCFIICGHSQRHFPQSSKGNSKFQQLIEKHTSMYANAPSISAKTVIVASIVDQLESEGCLFVKKESSKGTEASPSEHDRVFHAASPKCKKDKVGFALRQRIRKKTGKGGKRTTSKSNSKQSLNKTTTASPAFSLSLPLPKTEPQSPCCSLPKITVPPMMIPNEKALEIPSLVLLYGSDDDKKSWLSNMESSELSSTDNEDEDDAQNLQSLLSTKDISEGMVIEI